MIKSTFIFVLFCACFFNAKSQPINSRIEINLLNKIDFSGLYILDRNNLIYEDSIGMPSDSMCFYVAEPRMVILLYNNDIQHYIPFYLHEGNFSINIDLKSKNASFKNSKLNDEFLYLNNMNDSISKSYNLPRIVDLRKMVLTDSLKKYYVIRDNVVDELIYNYHLTHKPTYLTLSFIQSYLYCNTFDKSKLQILFDKLDSSFYNFRLYKESQDLLNIDPNYFPQPLWNEK